jgi:hypothetical protein
MRSPTTSISALGLHLFHSRLRSIRLAFNDHVINFADPSGINRGDRFPGGFLTLISSIQRPALAARGLAEDRMGWGCFSRQAGDPDISIGGTKTGSTDCASILQHSCPTRHSLFGSGPLVREEEKAPLYERGYELSPGQVILSVAGFITF